MSRPSKEKTIRFFKKATGLKRKITQEVFQQAITSLQAEKEIGFTINEIETLVSYIVLAPLPAKQFCAFIRCLVPNTSVSQKATKDVLTWIISHFRTAPITSTLTALQWITGLVEFQLADIKVIDGYYEFFFVLQRVLRLEPHACKLIYLLTKPDDVVRWKVQDALKRRLKNNGSHTSKLLCRYKQLKPECVPETIPANNYYSAFTTVSWLKDSFQLAQLRNNIIALEQGTQHLLWDDRTSIKRARKRPRTEVIPPINYLQVGSSLYEKKKKLSVLGFKDVVAVGCNLLSLESPANVSGLLVNKMGHYVLAFGDEELQMQFSITVFNQLHTVFHRRNYSYEDKEHLLELVVTYEEHMQKGIAVVSTFLAQYLLLWNGDDFQQYVFKLLEWVIFESFEELKYDILDSIHSLFFTSNVKTKCLIIASMRRLLINMFGAVTNHDGAELPSTTWDASTTIPQVITFVENLCTLGLIIEANNIALLDESFAFYEMVSHLEESSSLVIFTVIPSGILYRGLFTKVAVFIERVCSLLIRYKTVHANRLKALNSRAIFAQQFDMVKYYAMDVLNCLWDDRIISSAKKGHIFKAISPRVVNRFLTQMHDLDGCFSVTNHLALYFYTEKTEYSVSSAPSLYETYPNICNINDG